GRARPGPPADRRPWRGRSTGGGSGRGWRAAPPPAWGGRRSRSRPDLPTPGAGPADAQQHPDPAVSTRPRATGSAAGWAAASGAQHIAVSPSPRTWFVSWSASPVLTYHSHLAPSGSVTHVSTLEA